MKAELAALDENCTFSLVPLPQGKHPIGYKWVYKVKLKVGGSLEHYKARLVAQGFNQTEGVDYFETVALVAKITTIRFLLALAIVHGWFLH